MVNRIFLFISKNKKNILALLFLIITITIYLLPALTAKEKLFFDDVSVTYARLISVARSIKNGEIPFWDKNSFYGSRPYYVLLESPIYNIFLYPFFFITNTNYLDSSFFYLYILPFALQVIFGSIGLFLFSKLALKLTPFAASISAIIYITSPFFGSEIKSIHDTHIFSFIPWALLFLFLFLKSNKIKWWILSIMVLISMSISVTLNFLIKSYFMIGVIIFCYALYLLIKREIKVFTLFNALLAFIISILLLSFIWLGMFEGVKWVTEDLSFKFSDIVSDLHFNMFPGYLANIFIQDFHGLVSSNHAWGNAVKYDNNIVISGGFFSTLIITIAFFLFFKKRCVTDQEREEKILFFTFFIFYLISLFIIMGRFTFVFKFLCFILPFIFKMPYPFYFLFYQGFFYSILCGYGVKVIFENIEKVNKSKIHIFYIAFVFLVIILALLEPLYLSKTIKLSFTSIIQLKESKWFLLNKVLFFAGYSIIAIFIFKNIKKYKVTFLILLTIIESFFFGYVSLYKNTVWARLKEYSEDYSTLFRTRYLKPSEHFMFKDSYVLNNFLINKSSRFIGTVSSIDNMALIINKRSTLGYDSKPITKEMHKVVKKIASNYPYELYLNNFPIYLYKNLGIEYILTYNYLFSDFFINKGDSEYMLNNDENYQAPIDWPRLYPIVLSQGETGYRLNAYELIKPMPYLYFQTKVDSILEQNQFNHLCYVDTTKKITIEPEAYRIYRNIKYNFERNNKEKVVINKKAKEYDDSDFYNDGSYNDENKKNFNEKIKESGFQDDDSNNGNYNDENKKEITDMSHKRDFDILQKKNRVTKILESTSNKLKLEVKVEEPAILVRNEAYHKDWSFKIKDKSSGKIVEKGKIFKTNFIMQGVILKQGDYIVEYDFFPKSIKLGLIISVITMLFFLLYTAMLLILKQRIAKENA